MIIIIICFCIFAFFKRWEERCRRLKPWHSLSSAIYLVTATPNFLWNRVRPAIPVKRRSNMNGLRSLWKRNHDLELRLWQPELQSRGNSAPVAPIVLEDDDDDVQVSSPRSFARTSNLVAAASNRFTIINGGVLEHQQTSNSMSTQCDRFSVISERDLELRLGFAGTTSIQRMRPLGNHNGHREHNQTPSKDPIDLTLVNDECQLVGSITSKKRKHAPSVGGNEIKLACAICMDSMKEETSTICGHIFCKKCITASIQVQKKCPTCRRRLTMSNIHRIYLSSNVS